jgi:hypothetical protein
MCVALYYLVMKLIFWDSFPLGMGPLVIGMFFFISVQLIFLGIIGEYIISIQRSLRKLPIVTEKTRINYQSIANE